MAMRAFRLEERGAVSTQLTWTKQSRAGDDPKDCGISFHGGAFSLLLKILDGSRPVGAKMKTGRVEIQFFRAAMPTPSPPDDPRGIKKTTKI
jgi:hypothetical protein